MPILIVERGPSPGEQFSFASTVILGRGDQCTVQIKDTTVSRSHAEIRRTEFGFEIHDLGSANGTALNRRRIAEPEPLHDGDLLALGSVVLRFSTSEATMGGMAAKQVSDAVDEIARTLPAASKRASERAMQNTLARITMFCELGQFAVNKRMGEGFEDALLNSILHGFPAMVQMDMAVLDRNTAQMQWKAHRRRVGQMSLPAPTIERAMFVVQQNFDGAFAISESERQIFAAQLDIAAPEFAMALLPIIFQNQLIGMVFAYALPDDAPRASDRNALRAAAGISAAVLSARLRS